MMSPLRGLARADRSLLGAVLLGLAIAAVGSIFVSVSTPKAPKRRIVQAPLAAAALRVAKEVRIEPPPAPAEAPPIDSRLEAEPTSSGEAEAIASHLVPSEAPTPDPTMDEVNQYLWGVYERSTTKRDGTGDFTWKDIAAAARLGKSLGDYVIVGMDADFREILYRAGLAMDAVGMRWTILSGFRDDYRQGLAAGYKARTGDSLHGGSYTTGGYGHGCAVDIKDADGKSFPLWKWLDGNSVALDLERPLPGIDPAHVQPRGPWHEQAAALRNARLTKSAAQESAAQVSAAQETATPANAAVEADAATNEPVDLSSVPPSEADMACIGLHHHRQIETAQTDTAAPAEPQSFKAAARARGGGKARRAELKGESKTESKSASKAASRAADAGKSQPHGKGAARSQARHALHAVPHDSSAT